MIKLAIPWAVIIVIFLVCTGCHVLRGDQLLKEKYRKKHQRGMNDEYEEIKQVCRFIKEAS